MRAPLVVYEAFTRRAVHLLGDALQDGVERFCVDVDPVAAVGGRGEAQPRAQARRADELLVALDRERDRRGDTVGVGLGGGRLVGRDGRLDDLDRHLVGRLGRRGQFSKVAERRFDRRGGIGHSSLDGRHDRERPADERDPRVLRLTRDRIGEAEDPFGQQVGIECHLRRERHATERRLGVGDDPFDRIAFATDREGLGDHRLDVRPAPDLLERDGGLPAKAAEGDGAVAEVAVDLADRGTGRHGVKAGQVQRTDRHARQDTPDVLLVVRVECTGPDRHRCEQPDEEGDAEPKSRRGT